MNYRVLNAAGTVCCESDTAANLCSDCRATVKAANLDTLAVTRSRRPAVPGATAPVIAADEPPPPPTVEDIARAIANRPDPSSRLSTDALLARIPRPAAVE